nr:hypothetical protein [uncultured bacterium]
MQRQTTCWPSSRQSNGRPQSTEQSWGSRPEQWQLHRGRRSGSPSRQQDAS